MFNWYEADRGPLTEMQFLPMRIVSKITHGTLLIVISFTIVECNLLPKQYEIPQNGMYPGLPAKSLVWAKRNPYKTIDEVKRGEVVVFKRTQNNLVYDYIWRVVGLPKDTISLTNTSIKINGQELRHTFVRTDSNQTIYSEKNGNREYLVAYDIVKPDSVRTFFSAVVPEDELFVLGDNRDNAFDSRYHGAIKFESIVAKLLLKE